jgi:hypothetical protein
MGEKKLRPSGTRGEGWPTPSDVRKIQNSKIIIINPPSEYYYYYSLYRYRADRHH